MNFMYVIAASALAPWMLYIARYVSPLNTWNKGKMEEPTASE
jgi:hypothetical protein